MSSEKSYEVVDGQEEERLWRVKTVGEGRYEMVTPEGKTLEVDARDVGTGGLHLLVDGQSVDASVVELEEAFQVQVGAERHDVQVLNERQQRMEAAGAGAGAGGGPELVSPMAGKVVKIVGEVGSTVEEGDPLVVVEAMKMENDLQAHRAGEVVAIPVEEGQAVEIGDVLARIEGEEA